MWKILNSSYFEYRVGDAGAKKPTMMPLTLISHSFVTVSLITDTTTNDHFLLLVSLQILLLLVLSVVNFE